MIYWGINALNHGSSLAVFKNHKLLSLDVHDTDELASETIRQALNWDAPDKIFWYEKPWLKKARQLQAGQWNRALDLSVLPSKYLSRAHLHYAPVAYTPHHASHAAAGYYTSPFNHCAVVVLDAIGEFESATIWEGKHGELRKVWSRTYPNSLGLYYSAFTAMLGMQPIKDEYRLQQMAEQGNPARFRASVALYFREGILNMRYNFHKGVNDWSSETWSEQERCDLAAAVQEQFEHQVEMIMNKAKELVGGDCLVYMGGCAMNSAANKKIVEPMWTYTWSLPNPGDPTSAVGAVLYHTQQREWDFKWGLAKHLAIKV